MKYEVTETEIGFQPIRVVLTIESQAELDGLTSIANSSQISRAVKSIGSADPFPIEFVDELKSVGGRSNDTAMFNGLKEAF